MIGKVSPVAVLSACRELGLGSARSQVRRQPAWSRAMLRAGLMTAGAALAVVATLAALLDGPEALSTVVGTGALVVGFFVAGQLVEINALWMADARGLLIALGSFVVRVTVLGVLLWLVIVKPVWVEQISTTWFVISGCVAVAGWLAGILISNVRSRIPAYDDEGVSAREATR